MRHGDHELPSPWQFYIFHGVEPMKKYILFLSVLAAIGSMGCDDSGHSDSTKDGELKCSDDGKSGLVFDNGEWAVKEACQN